MAASNVTDKKNAVQAVVDINGSVSAAIATVWTANISRPAPIEHNLVSTVTAPTGTMCSLVVLKIKPWSGFCAMWRNRLKLSTRHHQQAIFWLSVLAHDPKRHQDKAITHHTPSALPHLCESSQMPSRRISPPAGRAGPDKVMLISWMSPAR